MNQIRLSCSISRPQCTVYSESHTEWLAVWMCIIHAPRQRNAWSKLSVGRNVLYCVIPFIGISLNFFPRQHRTQVVLPPSACTQTFGSSLCSSLRSLRSLAHSGNWLRTLSRHESPQLVKLGAVATKHHEWPFLNEIKTPQKLLTKRDNTQKWV